MGLFERGGNDEMKKFEMPVVEVIEFVTEVVTGEETDKTSTTPWD